ncbi:MAG: EAL domain-containing protein [Burkholderiales bacterium]|nr:EAL domain-containing protein [Burkholderiales bacterium]MDE2432827.1 EAL domain-containing protein [Burkholderiales bacterium]
MRFPQFNPRRLQARIVVVYLGMLLLVQAISYWFIQDSLSRNARATIHTELTNGQKVFKRLLAQKTENLEQATRVLASDFGFRAAVASGDQATIESALINHGNRIQANVAIFTDAAFQLKASATPINGQSLIKAVKAYALQSKEQGHRAEQIEVIDGQPYQIVAVPIKAPNVIGWVGMGFRVSDQVLKDLKDLSQLDVALLLQKDSQHWTVSASTMPSTQAAQLGTAWPAARSGPGQDLALLVNHEEFSVMPMALPDSHGEAPAVALLMESVAQATEPYNRLKLSLLILTGLGAVVFALGSVFTAKRITTPLRILSTSARRLEHGDYGARVEVASKDEIGELAHSFETMRQAIQAREGEIRRLAYQDSLTDLPNREQFRADLRQAIGRARSEGVPCTILLMDLDRFKHVNDVLGHRFGDRLLRSVAERLRGEALDPEDVLARLSGDEFAILLPGTSPHAATLLAKRILQAFERPFTLDDHTVDLSAGIGVACSPEHGMDVDMVMSRAEIAMYAAKQKQSGCVTYHAGLDSTSEESLTLISELRTAIDKDELRVYLQPKVNLQTQQCVGAEALVRWQHPTRGMVPPMNFIPFAEQTGFIRLITLWMIEQVTKQAAQLESLGLDLKISVNLSTRDLMDQDLPAKIERILAQYSTASRSLGMEITESAIMDDPQRALQTLNRLHDMGLKLSIDDFGTGYSSLAYLKRLPVDELKIDRSFVMNMESDVQDAKIVHSTIDLAHNLGLNVVAEGIENAQTLKLLGNLNCDEAQGYFIAKPMPCEDFAEWVAQWPAQSKSPEGAASDFAMMI